MAEFPELVFSQFRGLEFRLALDPKGCLGREVQRFRIAVGDEFFPDIPLPSVDFIDLLFGLLLLHIFCGTRSCWPGAPD
jgi:hypothetical protein